MRWLIGLLMLAGVAGAQDTVTVLTPQLVSNIGYVVEEQIVPNVPVFSEISQPPIYARWWREVGNCAQVKLDTTETAAIRFFAVNGRHFAPLTSEYKVLKFKGDTLWLLGSSRAADGVVILRAGHIFDAADVKHEMLHNVLYMGGLPYGHGDKGVTEKFEDCGIAETGQEDP